MKAGPIGSAEECTSDRKRGSKEILCFFGTAARMRLPFAETLKVGGGMDLSFTLDTFSFEVSIRHLHRQLLINEFGVQGEAIVET